MINEDIIVKCLAGEADQHELSLLNEWRKQSADNETTYQQIAKIWLHSVNTASEKPVDTNAAWNKVQAKIQAPVKVVKWPVKWLAAASVALLIGVAFFLSRTPATPAMLSSIAQNSAQHIQLKDGSAVTLKNGELQYPKTFDGKKRLVVLKSGTAYFDIHKDSAHPFEILCQQTTITVLGTEFEIKNIGEHTYVSVKEGKVRFSTPSGTSILTAGMQADYNAVSHALNTNNEFSKNSIAYATKQLSYNGSSLRTVLKDLKLHYPNYQIEVPGHLANCKISGDYNLDEGIHNILLVLATTLDAELKFNDKQHTASFVGGTCQP